MQNDLLDDPSDWPASYEGPVGQPPSAPLQPAPAVGGQGAQQASPLPGPTPNIPAGASPANLAALPVAAPLLLPHPFKLSAFPGFMSRSALFGVGRPGHGGPHSGWLHSAGEYHLNFEGERLSMLDKRVWEALVRFAKEKGVDIRNPFKVTLSGIARRAGVRGTGGLALPRVWACVERLAASKVQVDLGGSTRAGALLASATKDGRCYYARFDADFAMAILSDDIQFQFEDGRRDRLTLSLSQWFHDYFSTHNPWPRPYTVGYFRDMSGYRDQDSAFPRALRSAMAELAATCPTLVERWSIDDSDIDSACWKLAIKRGAERPSAMYPASMKTSATAPKPGSTKRRGGVSL